MASVVGPLKVWQAEKLSVRCAWISSWVLSQLLIAFRTSCTRGLVKLNRNRLLETLYPIQQISKTRILVPERAVCPVKLDAWQFQRWA
jgi:hypothetical protein